MTLHTSVGPTGPMGDRPPASNTGATFSPSNGGLRWDYSATTHPKGRGTGTVRDLYEALGSHSDEPGKGLQGWSDSLRCYDAGGDLVGTIYYGGREDVHCVVSGAVSDSARSAVSALRGASTSRVDTRLDTMLRYEDVAGLLQQTADTYGSKIITMQSSLRRKNLGRTMYLGAATSRLRVRLYEKHLESPAQYPEGLNRVEVQLRPDSKHKVKVSGWSRSQTFGASKTTRDLAALLGVHVTNAEPITTTSRVADLDRAMAAMGSQYGKTVRRFMERTGGDVNRLLSFLDLAETGIPFGDTPLVVGLSNGRETLPSSLGAAVASSVPPGRESL